MNAKPTLAEAIEILMQCDLIDAFASGYVEMAAKDRTPPQVIYRCGEGCGLLKVWQTKAGVVLAHIKKERQARTQSWRRPSPGSAFRLDHATDSTRIMGKRRYVLDDRPILLTCEHRSEVFDRAELLADVAEALKTRSTIKRTLAVS